MRSSASALVALGVLLACGGEDGGTPVLRFDTVSSCEEGLSCLTSGVEKYAMDGVRVMYKRLPGHPLVAARVLFNGNAGSGRQLWAESLVLALFELSGSSRFTSSSWRAELLRNTATLSTFRGLDYGAISLLAPLPRWRAVWDLTVESIARPNLSRYELENFRGNYQRSFTSERDDPDRAASIDAFSRLFQGETANLARDSQDALGAIGPVDLSDAWHDLFERQRLLVTVVGDVDRGSVDTAVRALASGLFLDSYPAFPRQSSGVASSPREVAVLPYPDSPNWYIDSYFRGPPAVSPDYPVLSLALEVLDQRLFREVRDVRGLAYTTGATTSFYRQSFGHLWLATQAPNEALAVARQVIAELESMGPDEAELEAARARIRTSLFSQGDDPGSLARTLADWELTAGAHSAMDDYLGAIERVQPAEVASTLSAYLHDTKTTAAGGGSELLAADVGMLFVSP